MLYNLIILFIIFIFSIFSNINSKIKKSFLIFFIITLSFNYKMGIDWTIYKNIYVEIVPKLRFIDILFGKNGINIEKGYLLLNYIFYNLGFNYEIFIGVLLSILNILIIKFLKKNTQNIFFALLIIFPTYLFRANTEPLIRQYISTVIILFGIKYIYKRQLFSYVLLILLALQFHKTAIIGIVFYFLYNREIKLRHFIFLFVFFGYLSNYSKEILNFILLNIEFFRKYLHYLNSSRFGTEKIRSIFSCIYYLLNTSMYMYILKKISFNKTDIFFKNICYLYLILFYYSYKFPVLMRLDSYFLIILGIIVSKVRGDKIKIGILILIINVILSSYGILKNEGTKFKYYYYHNYIIEVLKKGSFNPDGIFFYKKYREEYFNIVK